MKNITVFPDYPINVHHMEDLKIYWKRVLHARIEAATLLRFLNSPSRTIRTYDGRFVNKDYIVGVRDYVDPSTRKSRMARYERRNQVNLQVSMELSTVREVSGIISVRNVSRDPEQCLEKALAPVRENEFAGVLTDWNTTEKLDALIAPEDMRSLDTENLSHSYLAVNRNKVLSFTLIRELGDESVEELLKTRTASP